MLLYFKLTWKLLLLFINQHCPSNRKKLSQLWPKFWVKVNFVRNKLGQSPLKWTLPNTQWAKSTWPGQSRLCTESGRCPQHIHKSTCLNKKRDGARHHDFWRENFSVCSLRGSPSLKERYITIGLVCRSTIWDSSCLTVFSVQGIKWFLEISYCTSHIWNHNFCLEFY